jgi:hypothetical protein
MRWWRRAEPGTSQAEPSAGQVEPSAGRAEPSATPAPVSPDLLAWAQAVDATQLSDMTVKLAERFLRDYRRMNYLARREGGLRLRSVIEAEVRPGPPASIAAVDVAATVLSARRRQLGIE